MDQRNQKKEIPPKNRISYQLLYPSIAHVLFSAFRFTALPPAANFGTEIPNSAWVTRATMVSVCTASWSFCCTVSVDNLYCRYIMLSLLKHSLYLYFLTFDVCVFFVCFFGYETTRSSSAGNCFAASSKSTEIVKACSESTWSLYTESEKGIVSNIKTIRICVEGIGKKSRCSDVPKRCLGHLTSWEREEFKYSSRCMLDVCPARCVHCMSNRESRQKSAHVHFKVYSHGCICRLTEVYWTALYCYHGGQDVGSCCHFFLQLKF